ncbi:MAG: HAD family hydrolase [Candidatus Binatia bacterium]
MDRLILFDLDGTLIRSYAGFVPFNQAIEKTFGLSADIRTVIPDGNTDPLILEDVFDTSKLRVKITKEKWASFAKNLVESYTNAIAQGLTKVIPLTGVLDLVKELAKKKGLHQGVVTGNLEATGRLKLQAAGLALHVGLGAYGSDSRNRVDLPRIAKQRWETVLGRSICSHHCVIVGDTAKDLIAARQNHMKCVLVGTGRYPVEELGLLGPDVCLSDLTDTKAAAEALLNL